MYFPHWIGCNTFLWTIVWIKCLFMYISVCTELCNFHCRPILFLWHQDCNKETVRQYSSNSHTLSLWCCSQSAILYAILTRSISLAWSLLPLNIYANLQQSSSQQWGVSEAYYLSLTRKLKAWYSSAWLWLAGIKRDVNTCCFFSRFNFIW